MESSSMPVQSGKPTPSQMVTTRVALVGTGYIAEFHARALRAIDGVDITCVCDSAPDRAKAFATTWRIPQAFDCIATMLANAELDCVHILTPPDQHFELAETALLAGLHVLLEKPMCTTVTEADRLVELASQQGLYLGVSHNFTYSDAFERLRRLVRSNVLGLIDQVTFNYLYEMPQLRFGPFDQWMLRSPGHLILETAPHLLSALKDLIGDIRIDSAEADREWILPTGVAVYRRWRVRATAGRTALDMTMNFSAGFPQRTILLRGLFGSATVDLDANTCIVDQRTPMTVDFDRFQRGIGMAWQHSVQASRVLTRYALGKFNLRSGAPFQNSIRAAISTFYTALRHGGPLDPRVAPDAGRVIIQRCEDIVAAANIVPLSIAPPRPAISLAEQPKILVLGGAGFIGQELIRQLLEAGHSVRAMVRGSPLALDPLRSDRLEIVRGDIRRRLDLETAIAGVDVVYHLAHAQCRTWQDYQDNDIGPTRTVGEICLASGVKRLIYAGTIDCYYAGAKAGVITEETPLDPNIVRRNYYARAKAAAETLLLEMHKARGLALVILRPGIVIGRGTSPFHWGVGRFTDNICEVWGDGRNKLPLVLVSDVAAAFVTAMTTDGINGCSFNLIDQPFLSANEYLDELERLAGQPVRVQHRLIWRFYASDLLKWIVKMIVGHHDRIRIPSYFDWESRTQNASFDCTRARTELRWSPASTRERMIQEGIGGALQSWLEMIK
jgi:nucleoside-diphosphate-sugar epimerase/predicted dehydrogenase